MLLPSGEKQQVRTIPLSDAPRFASAARGEPTSHSFRTPPDMSSCDLFVRKNTRRALLWRPSKVEWQKGKNPSESSRAPV